MSPKPAPRPVVLVVEDSLDYQRILGRILKPAGYRVVLARSAEEAGLAVAARAPDVAILDWNLPGMDGMELSKRLRRDPRFCRTVIIMLTVNARPEDQVRGLREGGADMYLAKPVVPQELLARISGFLRLRKGAA